MQADNFLALEGQITGGKHAGKMFSQVFTEDFGYVQWAVGQLAAGTTNGGTFVEKLALYGQARGVAPKQAATQQPWQQRQQQQQQQQWQQQQQQQAPSQFQRQASQARQQWQTVGPAEDPAERAAPPPKRARPLALPGESGELGGWTDQRVASTDPFVGARSMFQILPGVTNFGASLVPEAAASRTDRANEMIADVRSCEGALLESGAAYPELRNFFVKRCRAAWQARHEAISDAFQVELEEGYPLGSELTERRNVARCGTARWAACGRRQEASGRPVAGASPCKSAQRLRAAR